MAWTPEQLARMKLDAGERPSALYQPGFRPAHERSALGKVLHVLGTTERMGVDLAEELLPREVQSKIDALRARGQDVYAQDVVNLLWEPEESDPWYEKVARGALGFTAGVLVDPLSYFAPGITKLGRVAGMAPMARQALAAGKAVKVPKGLARAARAVPEGRLTEAAAVAGRRGAQLDVFPRMKSEEYLRVLDKLGGRAPDTALERRVVESFWRNLVPDMPAGLQAQLKEGTISLARLELPIPFSPAGIDLEDVFRRVGLAAALEKPRGAVAATMGVVKRQVGKHLADTQAARAWDTLRRGFIRYLNLPMGVTPRTVLLGRRAMDAFRGLKNTTPKKVAHALREHADVIGMVASDTGRPALEIHEGVRRAILDLGESTKYEHGRLTPRHWRVDWKKEPEAFAEGALEARPVFIEETRDIDQLFRRKLDDLGVELKSSDVDEALDTLSPTDPKLGGPLSPFDTETEAQIRRDVVAIHESNVLQQIKEFDAMNKPAIMLGDGGYMARGMKQSTKDLIRERTKEAYRPVSQVRKSRLPGPAYHHAMKRMSRLIVPEEVRALKPKLLKALDSDKKKLFPDEAVLDAIMEGSDFNLEEVLEKIYQGKLSGSLEIDDVNRLVHNLSVDEVNRRVHQFGYPGKRKGEWLLKPGEVEEFFDPDIGRTLYNRIVSGDGQILRAHFIKDLKKMYTDVPFGAELEPGWIRFGEGKYNVAGLEGLAMHRLDAEFVNQVATKYEHLDGTVNAFLKQYDTLLQVWKLWTLAPHPSWWNRNMIGNLWNNSLYGVSTKENILAARVRRWMAKGDLDHVVMKSHPVTGETIRVKDLVNIGDRRNLWNIGLVTSDTPEKTINARIAKEIRRRRKLSKKKSVGAEEWLDSELLPANENMVAAFITGHRNAFTSTGYRLNGWYEDQAKIANMIHSLKSGLDLDQSVDMAKKFLLDYSRLNDFEKNVWRRIFPFYSWCCSEDTECLSREGWKHYQDVSVGEEILAYKDGALVWDTVEAVNVFPYDGELVRTANARDEFLYTPSHRCLIRDEGGNERFVTALGLRSNHSLIRSGNYTWSKESVLSTRDAAILGWIVSDGYFRWRGSHMEALIYQSPGKYLDEIVGLLGEEGSPRDPHPDSGVVPVGIRVSCTRRLKKVFRSKEDLPGIISRLDRPAAQAMYDAMFKAEGSSTETFEHFAQNPGPVLDAFQMLTILFGKTSHISNKGLYISQGRPMKLHGHISTAWYRGNVWCPTTGTGTWVSRRKGRVVITGNSRGNIPLQLEHLAKRPYRALNVHRLYRSLQTATGVGITPPEERLISPWFKHAGAVRIRKSKDGKYFMFASATGWLPLMDLNEAFDLWSMMRFNLAPIPRGVIEHLANIDVMTGRKIDLMQDAVWKMGKGERGKLFGVDVPRHIYHAARSQVRLVRAFDDIVANPQELDWITQVLRHVVGFREYKLHPDRSRAQIFKILRDWSSRYRKAVRSRLSYGDVAGARRVQRGWQEKLEELLEEYAQVRSKTQVPEGNGLPRVAPRRPQAGDAARYGPLLGGGHGS